MIDWAVVSAIATAIAAICAAVAAIVSMRSLAVTRSIAAEQRSSSLVQKYLELTLQLTEFSTGGTKKDKEEQRYSWFVSFVFMMARETLRAYPNDKNWRKMMLDQVSYLDEDELRAWTREQLSVFGADVESLVDEVLGRKVKTA